MSGTRDAAKEKVYDILQRIAESFQSGDGGKADLLDARDDILAIPELAVVDRDASREPPSSILYFPSIPEDWVKEVKDG